VLSATGMSVNGDFHLRTTYGPVQGMASLRTTARGKKVYVHLFDWPSATLEIKGTRSKSDRGPFAGLGSIADIPPGLGKASDRCGEPCSGFRTSVRLALNTL